MIDDDIVSAIQRMSAAWPYVELTDPQVALWCEILEPLDRSSVRETTERLIRSSERFPSPAGFLSEYQNVVGRRDEGVCALPAPPVDREACQRFIQLAHQAIGESKPHDHRKGWRGCPVCKNWPPTVPTGSKLDL